MISQKELARRLNISPATVSKALRDATDVSPELKARIRSEASQAGLKGAEPQPGGRRAAAGDASARFLGVVYVRRSSVLATNEMLYFDGFSEEADARGLPLVVHQCDQDGRVLLDPNNWPTALRGGLVDGLALVFPFEPEVVRFLAERFPVVTLTHWVPGARADLVDSDHLSGMDRLVGHLAELGHRRIGYLMTGGPTVFERSRYTSMIRALMLRDLPPPAACWSGDGDSGHEELHRAAAQAVIEGRGQGITAWMAASDRLIDRILPYLSAAGLRVPEDVSLTGFDNFQHILTTTRRITTVQTPSREMGREAIRLLLERVADRERPPRQLLMDTPLVIGDTTGPSAVKRR